MKEPCRPLLLAQGSVDADEGAPRASSAAEEAAAARSASNVIDEAVSDNTASIALHTFPRCRFPWGAVRMFEAVNMAIVSAAFAILVAVLLCFQVRPSISSILALRFERSARREEERRHDVKYRRPGASDAQADCAVDDAAASNAGALALPSPHPPLHNPFVPPRFSPCRR
jgi:hypothetical protein